MPNEFGRPTFAELQGESPPTLYVDGTAINLYDVDAEAAESIGDREGARVQVEWDAIANGYEEGIVNSAAIDWTGDSLALTVSTGDPRGAFALIVRRVEPDDGEPYLVMHVPTAGDHHEKLTELHPGTYRIG